LKIRKIALPIIHTIYAFIFLLGLALLGLNLTGMITSLRNEDVFTLKTGFENDITLNEEEFYALISEQNEPVDVYVVKTNQAVNQAIAHYWGEEGIEQFNLRVPLQENFVLYLLYRFFPEVDQRYEFCNYRKAIERGVGFCSQQALILDAILDEKGIRSKILSFPWLHVLDTVQVGPEAWWLADPDYGVVVPYSIDMVAQNPQLITPYYAASGYEETTIQYLQNIFQTEYVEAESTDLYFPDTKCQIERTTYVLKWFFPAFFLLVGSVPYVRHLRSL
jgi:hypothetical protein